MRRDIPPWTPRFQDEHDQAEWERLSADQNGLLTCTQLAGFGITQQGIGNNVCSGRWRRLLPRVIATFTGVPSRTAVLTAVLLYAGPDAVLSHRTAAEEWRMVPIEPGPIHVTVPYGRSAVSQEPWVVVHRSRALRHIRAATDPPRTSRADTVVDLAVAEPDARSAMRRLVALATRGRVPVLDLRRRLDERRPRRYSRALRDSVRLLSDGVQSALEQRYACDVELAHGLPGAHRQQPVVVDGRTLWEDAVYDHLGVQLTVRLDGRAFHDAPEVAFRDRRRDNAAELAGRQRLVYGWAETADDPCGVASEVLRILYRGGWHGPVRHCGARNCEWRMNL